MLKVTKFSGEVVPFNADKLKASLLKSGASMADADAVMTLIEKEIYEGIPTKRIYKLAFSFLKKISKAHAARYNLRAGIKALGPDGFYFEKFVAKIYEHLGYTTITNQQFQGHCVSHEVDVLIKNKDDLTMIECKFHNFQDAKTDVKVPMYILSRFNDLKTMPLAVFEGQYYLNNCMIATNNKFTQDAIQFAECMGMKLLSWDYPKNASLKFYIDDFQLYPVTCLTTLALIEKDKLLHFGIVTVKDLLQNINAMYNIGISDRRVKNVLKESNELCKLL